MKIAGVWSGHDCSFYICEDGKPIVHAEYERYTREKEPPGDSLGFLFDEYKNYSDIKHVASCFPINKLTNYQQSYAKMNDIVKSNGGKIHYFGHHKSHAANAFFSSNFDESLIVTLDGGGVEEENFVTACTVWHGNKNKIKHLRSIPIHKFNIGGVWTRSTRYIFNLQSGWPRGHQAGSVMAMAALGDPKRFEDDFYRMLTKDLNMASRKPSDQPKGANVGTDPKHPYLHKWRLLADIVEGNRYDLAAGLQSATERLLREMLTSIFAQVKTKYLCLSGGVVLNSVAIGKIRHWFPHIEEIYVTPTPHDGGLTIGAAQYLWHNVLDNPRITWEDNFTPYLGFTHDNIESTIESYGDKITSKKCDDLDIVNYLYDDKIVAVFGGGSESGRRALGNRSILANPTSPEMKAMINDKVKHRQWYRPFAPSILREEVKNWFVEDKNSPYMSFVVKFKEEVKDKVPAVLHFDNTGRLQTVTENDNPWYYNLIKQWHNKSGVPILLNTSFNDREPICETAEHAINCFLRTNIDYLYFYEQNILVEKK